MPNGSPMWNCRSLSPDRNSRATTSPTSRRSRKHMCCDKIANADYGWFAPFRDKRRWSFTACTAAPNGPARRSIRPADCLYVTANKLPWMVTIARRRNCCRERKPPLTAGNKIYLQYCAGCHGRIADGVGMGPPLFTLPGRLRDAQVVQAIRNGRGIHACDPCAGREDEGPARFPLRARSHARQSRRPAPDRYTYRFIGYNKLLDQDDRPGVKPPWATLNAIDLSTGRIAWRVPLGEYEDLAAQRHRKFRRRDRDTPAAWCSAPARAT